VKPSSSTSEARRYGLFDGVLARGDVPAAVSDRAWLEAMLEVEAALARALARTGVIRAEEAVAIERACRADEFDIESLGRDAVGSGNPVVPLVRELTNAVEGSAAGQVHRGATSQDVLDTAAMLVARRAGAILCSDLSATADAAAELADTHRATLMAGRTLLQQALPITFGLEAAGWLEGVDAAVGRLADVCRTRLAVQLGGAAGTLASLGSDGPAVLGFLARDLELPEPVLPWHTDRTRLSELAGALGAAAGAVGKPARDVILLAQTEIGEVREGTPNRGGSSTLPHKRNPIAAVSALACAEQAPGLVAILFGAMVHEHQRAAGSWHAEWRPFTDLWRAVGSSAAWLRDCLEHLEVRTATMRQNLDLTGGLLLAERVATALAPALGRLPAHELVERASRDAVATSRPLGEVVAEMPEASKHLDVAELKRLLDPAGYLGSAEAFIDRALEAHVTRGAHR